MLDLQGKRVAMIKDSTHANALLTLLHGFDITIQVVDVESYEEGMKLTASDAADAVVVSRVFGLTYADKGNLHHTHILFNPIEIRYAAPKDKNSEVITAIDRNLTQLKQESDSLYQRAFSKAFGLEKLNSRIPHWLYWIVGTALLLSSLLIILNRTLNHLVKQRTRELQQEVEERKRIEQELKQSQNSLESRIDERTVALSKEINERKVLEVALKNERDFLSAVLDNIEDGVVACNEQGVLTIFNRASREFHGLPEQAIPAEKWAEHYDLFLADGKTRMQKKDIPLFMAFEGQTITDIEMVIAPKNSPSHIVSASGQPLINQEGKIVGAVVSMHDVTLSKLAEKSLQRANAELELRVEQRTAELKQSNENLSNEIKERTIMERRLLQAQKMEAIGTLAGGIAHDFNNLLGVILGYSELAKKGVPSESKLAGYLEKILIAGHRAKDLIAQILSFSRQSDVKYIPLKLQPLVKESIKMLRSSIPSTIEIIDNIDSDCDFVVADPTQIHQILLNLCTNASQAMEQSGGRLTIGLQPFLVQSDTISQNLRELKPGSYVELSVSDTGTGIADDIIDKIFEPYFTTKEIGKGTGMGLAIIHGIVTKLAGTITVESRLGEGTSFRVYLPTTDYQPLPIVEQTRMFNSAKGHILFVDDEELLVNMGRELLSELGYTVTVEQSSQKALETFKNSPDSFDAVITDQTMPVMTGAELAREILQIRPDTPIILCSGYSSLINEESAKAIGIKVFAQKPVSIESLAYLLHDTLNQTGSD